MLSNEKKTKSKGGKTTPKTTPKKTPKSTPKKKIKKELGRRFKAVLFPPGSGKSMLAKILHQSNSLNKMDNIFVDIDSFNNRSCNAIFKCKPD